MYSQEPIANTSPYQAQNHGNRTMSAVGRMRDRKQSNIAPKMSKSYDSRDMLRNSVYTAPPQLLSRSRSQSPSQSRRFRQSMPTFGNSINSFNPNARNSASTVAFGRSSSINPLDKKQSTNKRLQSTDDSRIHLRSNNATSCSRRKTSSISSGSCRRRSDNSIQYSTQSTMNGSGSSGNNGVQYSTRMRARNQESAQNYATPDKRGRSMGTASPGYGSGSKVKVSPSTTTVSGISSISASTTRKKQKKQKKKASMSVTMPYVPTSGNTNTPKRQGGDSNLANTIVSPGVVKLEQELNRAVKMLTMHVENVSTQLHSASDKISESVQQGVSIIQQQQSANTTPVKSMEQTTPTRRSSPSAPGSFNKVVVIPTDTINGSSPSTVSIAPELSSHEELLLAQMIQKSLRSRITSIYNSGSDADAAVADDLLDEN